MKNMTNMNYIDTDNTETKQLLNGLFGTIANENVKLKIKQQACENIIEIVKTIDRIAQPLNMAYKPEQKEQILNKLYDLLNYQISLMEDNEDE